MNAFLTSLLVIFLAEMGDKTQLLAFSLSHRFRKPWPVMTGILCATLVNHALSAWLGAFVGGQVPRKWMEALLALTFIGFGIWALVPDKEAGRRKTRYGAFLTTLVLFFLVEIGDKTQLATMALGAQFRAPLTVTAGTTLGMLMADGAGVFLGLKAADRLPLKWLRWATAAIFIALGLAAAYAFFTSV